MIALDLRTAFASYAVMGFVCLAVVLAVWWQNRTRYLGLLFIVFDVALQAVGMFLIALRSAVPDWLSVVVSNCGLVGGLVLGYMGLQRLLNRRTTQIPNYLLLVGFAFVQAFFTYAAPRLDIRILNTAVVQLLIWPQYVWLITNAARPRPRWPALFTASVFVGYMLVNVGRIVSVVRGVYASDDYMRSGSAESISVIAYMVLLVLFTYGVTLLVSDRLRAAVTAQEDKFARTFRSTPSAILVNRFSDGRIIEVNDAFTTISGYSREEALSATVDGLDVWVAESEREAIIRDVAAGTKVSQRELRLRRKSGQEFTALYSADVMLVDGEVLVLSNVTDIDERKQAEDRLRESQEQLLQAQKMEAVGQLAGGIAHDFNNLLGVILGYTEMALGEVDSSAPRSAGYLRQVKGAAERAAALTRQILAFSRRQTMRPVVLSLNEVVSGMEPLLRRTLGEDIELLTSFHQDAALVEADRNQLGQVLMNLAVNARDAMSSGGTLTIRTAPWSQVSARRATCVQWRRSAGRTSWFLPSPIRAWAWTPAPASECSSRSSAPRTLPWVPAWACRWSTESSSRAGATST